MSFTEQEIEEFKTESLDILELAEKSLLAIDKDPEFAKLFDSIFRCFHNLKGAAGMMEMTSLQSHVHELETILMQFKPASTIPADYVRFFLGGIDGARSLLNGEQIEFSYRVTNQIESKNVEQPPRPEAEVLVAHPSKDQGKSKTQELAPAVLEEFKTECEEIIDRVATHLNFFAQGDFSQGKIEELYRDVHSLKGSAYLFSFVEIGDFAHEMETTLEPFREKSECPGKSIIDGLYTRLRQIDDCVFTLNNKPNSKSEIENLSPNSESNLGDAKKMEQKLDTTTKLEAKTSSKDAEANSTIRVAVSLLDNLMTLMGEMVLVRNQVLQFSSKSEDLEFLNLSKRLNVVTSEIQGEMMKTRMQPIGNIFSKYSRVVHDLASELKKEISLNLSGSETELDKSLLEAIKDPLTHIVRNSCDHGIEVPEARVQAGKPKVGSISIKAYHEGGQVVIEVQDDGKGLNKEVLLKKALEKNIIRPNQASTMNEKEIFNLIFAPGFSTAASITNVSGRGVGMDVVRTNVERIGGTVDLESEMGKGTVIKLRIPLTLAIVPALIVKTSGETFAIPQIKLEELVRVEGTNDSNKIEKIHGVPVYRLRDKILPLVDLGQVLKSRPIDKSNESTNIVVLNADRFSFGLIVEEILDTADIVVKPINRLLKSLQVYSGATILGDGNIALILDVLGISSVAQLSRQSVNASTTDSQDSNNGTAAILETQEFLVVKLGSPTKHAIPLSDVHRLEEFPISRVEYFKKRPVIRYGENLLPLISLNESLGYESVTSLSQKSLVSVVVVEKAGKLFGLEVDEIVDTISTQAHVDPTLMKEDGIFGNLNLPNELIIVLDAFSIIDKEFSDSATKPVTRGNTLIDLDSRSKPLSILVVEDTTFFRREISRILSTEGHRTVLAKDGLEAIQILESKENTFDLVISDIEMPRMNGFDLAKAIKNHQQLKHLPLIAISSKADKKYTEKGLEAGFDIYLEKLKTDTLLGAIATVSPNRSAA